MDTRDGYSAFALTVRNFDHGDSTRRLTGVNEISPQSQMAQHQTPVKATHTGHSALAVQIAVLRETEAQGPFCSLVMAVVVVKDVLVFVAFATNLEIVSAVCSLDSALGCP